MLSVSLNKTFLSVSLSHRAGAQPVSSAGFGRGSGPIYLDDLACTGTEQSILQCSGKPLRQTNCYHSEDAGVRCHTGTLVILQRCQLVRFIRKPYRFLRFAWAYGHTMQSLLDIYDFCRFNTYNHSRLYIRTVVSLQWHHLFFVRWSMLPLLTTESTKINDLCHNKLCFVCYCICVLWRDPMPKLCFVMVLTSCNDFLQIVRIFCHDLTDMSCSRLTPLWYCKLAKWWVFCLGRKGWPRSELASTTNVL